MSGTGATPSPWGEPVRIPTAESTRTGMAKPPVQPAWRTWDHTEHHHWPERARAALSMAVVAIILGAAAAVVLGVGVWALAALFHHAASG